tara:strand:+ start:677 stop:952 length:276 start_codon:yes stop_codon:yes gene_type:complete
MFNRGYPFVWFERAQTRPAKNKEGMNMNTNKKNARRGEPIWGHLFASKKKCKRCRYNKTPAECREELRNNGNNGCRIECVKCGYRKTRFLA